MPKLISEIQNPIIQKWAEDEKERQGISSDNICSIDWSLTKQMYTFWEMVYEDDPALLSHPLYPKEDLKGKKNMLIFSQTVTGAKLKPESELCSHKTVTLEQYKKALNQLSKYEGLLFLPECMTAIDAGIRHFEKIIETFEKENNLK